jgi:hypothetical protein
MLLTGGIRGNWQDEFWEEIENSVRYDIQASGVPCLILKTQLVIANLTPPNGITISPIRAR